MLPTNNTRLVQQQPFPWWEPSKKGEDILKDYKLSPIENFPFVQPYTVTISYLGQEFTAFRPMIYGVYIQAPNVSYFGGKDARHNEYVKLKYLYGGMWIEEGKSFALHVEWWNEKLKGYNHNKPIYEADPYSNWVENCYFRIDKESETWVPMNPDEKELEQVRLWAILSELGE